jgi:hypothetical protein
MLDRVCRLMMVVVLVLCAAVSVAPAEELRLQRQYSDNMVLQRGKPVLIRGMAKPGDSVTVQFAGQEKSGTAGGDSVWSVTLDPMDANAKGQRLAVKAPSGKVTLKDVLVGDVILFARQTSIDVTLGRDADGRKLAEGHGQTPRLRVLNISSTPAATPQSDLDADATSGWVTVDKRSAPAMSAAAYYLARDLSEQSEVPIGMIDLNMGSAFPISWLSREALLQTETFYGKSDVPGQLKRFDTVVELAAKGEPLPRKDVLTSNFLQHATFPSGGYNAVLNPLKGLTLKAAVVQLGNDYPHMIYAEIAASENPFDRLELNRAYVQTYDIRKVGFRMEPVTTPRIPSEWRKALGDEDLPFGLILPPGSDLNTLGQHHREMRELHRQTALKNTGIGLIMPGSENVPYSAQPQDEALLAVRCLSWVQGAVYGKADVVPTGPVFARMEPNFNEATIYFTDGTATGLSASGDALGTFEAAGTVGEYAPVTASVSGETIRIKSDTINRITRVRYNWNTRPDQGLVNAAGLPALPFRTEEAVHDWYVDNKDDDLPSEYSTPANTWKESDVTLINGQLKTHGYENFTGWLGPIGIKTGPFGPNMGVREVMLGSPADGTIFVGDVIYSANANMLGEKAWEVMAAAITESETRRGGGKLVLGIRRDGKNLDVEVGLKVMGSYSSTAPYDCPKSEEIIADLETWVVQKGAGAGFLNADAIFLLATGNPELQGYVRRLIYAMIAGKDPSRPMDPAKGGKSWHNSAEAILLGEYFLATGDRIVLPHLKHACARLAVTQNESGGWRHNFPGGPNYGFIPNAGLPGVMGMHFAKVAGLDIDLASYELGVKHFGKDRAETGYLIYGSGDCERPVPVPFDPETMATGHMESYNGGLSSAGILMGLYGNHRAAHMCSLISAYAWNNTFHGHGGNFWNNFWTPLGAHQHSKAAFIHFWKNHRWYRESNRMFDGGLIQDAQGGSGAGPGVALVAPRRRIQIVGAPPSPFAADAIEALTPALDAYAKRDYAACEERVAELIAAGVVGKTDMPTVEYLGRAARDIQASITADLARMQQAVDAGRPADAKADLAQLEGVMAKGDARLAAIKDAIASAKPTAQSGAVAKVKKGPKQVGDERDWTCLVTEIATEASRGDNLGKVEPEAASTWRLKVVEHLSQAPADWTQPSFDDSAWAETHLPISWRMYHTALLRTTFTVEDKSAFDGLRFRAWLFRQQGVEISLNGELIGKINNLEKKTGNVENAFKDSAVKLLKNGENTLTVSSRHNWRWGMLFMKVYNDGFGFRLDARAKE